MRGSRQSNSLSDFDEACTLPSGDERGDLRSTRSLIRTLSPSLEMVTGSAYAMYSSLSMTITHSAAALPLSAASTRAAAYRCTLYFPLDIGPFYTRRNTRRGCRDSALHCRV